MRQIDRLMATKTWS